MGINSHNNKKNDDNINSHSKYRKQREDSLQEENSRIATRLINQYNNLYKYIQIPINIILIIGRKLRKPKENKGQIIEVWLAIVDHEEYSVQNKEY